MTPLPASCISSKLAGDLVGLPVVHEEPFGIDPGEVHLDERVAGGGAQGVHAVAARAVGADQALVLGLLEVVHRAGVLGGPVLLLHAVEKSNINIIDAKLAAVALEVALAVVGVGGVGLGLDDVAVAGDAFEGVAEIDVGAVLVGDVEEADAAVEGVADDLLEAGEAEPGLVAGVADADAAGAHADERDLHAGPAEGAAVGGRLGQVGRRSGSGEAGDRGGQGGGGGCLGEEVAAMERGRHGGRPPCWGRVRGTDILVRGRWRWPGVGRGGISRNGPENTKVARGGPGEHAAALAVHDFEDENSGAAAKGAWAGVL